MPLPVPVFMLLGLLVIAAAIGSDESHADSAKTHVLDGRALPLGDGKISTAPRRGHVYACNTQFRGGGAHRTGDWIHGSTWDQTKKIWVQGEILWPTARFALSNTDNERRIDGNGLPINHATGSFPIRLSDPAYQFDRNPNPVTVQQLAFALPQTPAFAATPGCLPMGMIGVALSGVAIYNAVDEAGRDAVAHEIQDRCQGHPQQRGQYHYHGPSDCVPGTAESNTLVGYALDGFGIYSGYDENGKELTNADLDECHGRSSPILWNGRTVVMYHYVLTREYPYTLGCFRGTPIRVNGQPGSMVGPGGSRQPPAEAQSACNDLLAGTPCRFLTPRGDALSGNCRTVPAGGASILACVPHRP